MIQREGREGGFPGAREGDGGVHSVKDSFLEEYRCMPRPTQSVEPSLKVYEEGIGRLCSEGERVVVSFWKRAKPVGNRDWKRSVAMDQNGQSNIAASMCETCPNIPRREDVVTVLLACRPVLIRCQGVHCHFPSSEAVS